MPDENNCVQNISTSHQLKHRNAIAPFFLYRQLIERIREPRETWNNRPSHPYCASGTSAYENDILKKWLLHYFPLHWFYLKWLTFPSLTFSSLLGYFSASTWEAPPSPVLKETCAVLGTYWWAYYFPCPWRQWEIIL